MKHDTPHPSDETLLRAVHGELPPRRRDTLDAHLAAGCDGCRSRLRAIQASADEVTARVARVRWRGSRPWIGCARGCATGLEQRSSALDRSVAFPDRSCTGARAFGGSCRRGGRSRARCRSHQIRGRAGRSAGSARGNRSRRAVDSAITPVRRPTLIQPTTCAGRGPVKERSRQPFARPCCATLGWTACPIRTYEARLPDHAGTGRILDLPSIRGLGCMARACGHART